MLPKIYLSPPDVGPAEEAAVQRAMKSKWVAPLGPEVDEFEREISERVGGRDAVALSSGTAGLHLALLAHGVKPGDTVLTSTMTFAATANAIRYAGAEPVFVDSLAESGNVNPELLAKALADSLAAGRLPAAVIVVDLLGKMVDYSSISVLCAGLGIPLIADAAESVGSASKGAPSGSFGDTAVFSFNGNKIMTTSGGGMLVTPDAGRAARVRHLATQARLPVPHYEHDEVGYNYRLSNILAALGRAQLSRLDEMLIRRRQVREYYRELLGGVRGVTILGGESDSEDNCWLTSVVIDESLGWGPSDLRVHLAQHNIESRPLWKPMHLQPAFHRHRSYITGHAERLYQRGLALPSGSLMGGEELVRIQSAIESFLAERTA